MLVLGGLLRRPSLRCFSRLHGQHSRLAADPDILALGRRRRAGFRGPVPDPDDDASRAALRGLLKRSEARAARCNHRRQHAVCLAAANWTQFPFLMVIVPLMAAAAFLAPFDMAVACGSVGAALVGLAVLRDAAGPRSVERRLRLSVFSFRSASSRSCPSSAGLIIEQTRVDRRRIAESEQRFRRAMEDSAIGVVVVGLDGRIVEVEPRLRRHARLHARRRSRR